MQESCGCRHCLGCLPVALTYALCDHTRRTQVNEPYQPWWPASIDSPTHYFRLKRRALAHLFREQAAAGFSDPATWRASHTSAAAGCLNELLARRGVRQLSVRLPTGRTNLHTADGLEFVGCLSLEQPMQQQQQQQQQQLAAPPRAPTPPLQQHAQQQHAQQQQQGEPKRPHAWRAAPLPPATQHQLEAAAAAQQLQASMSLLASLQYQEQRHRQQFAATAPAWAAAGYSTAPAHPAAAGTWPCGWGAQQQQQQQQQQQWPFAVPAPQQGGWSYGETMAALHATLAC